MGTGAIEPQQAPASTVPACPDDGVDGAAHVLRAQAMGCKQLLEQGRTGCRRRFGRDTQTRRHHLELYTSRIEGVPISFSTSDRLRPR